MDEFPCTLPLLAPEASHTRPDGEKRLDQYELLRSDLGYAAQLHHIYLRRETALQVL